MAGRMKYGRRVLRYMRGVTLVELMVVVAVLVILATVALPIYTNQSRKARRSDARVALLAVAQAQERRYTAVGSYTTVLGDLDLSSSLQGGTSEDGYYAITITGGGNSYTIKADPSSSSQAHDSCTELTLNQLGVRDGTGDDCW